MTITNDAKRTRVVDFVKRHFDDFDIEKIHRIIGNTGGVVTDRAFKSVAQSFEDRFPDAAKVKTSLNGFSTR